MLYNYPKNLTLAICFLVVPASIVGAPINVDSALTVAKGLSIFRAQIRFTRKSGDPSPSDRIVEVTKLSTLLLHGITARFIVIESLPLFSKKLTLTPQPQGERIVRESAGFGDLTVLGKYRFFTRDKPGQTTRASVVAGLKFPTGRSDKKDIIGLIPPPIQSGTGSWDFPFGLLFSSASTQRELDIVFRAKINRTNDAGFKFGNIFLHDLAYQHRISTHKDAKKPQSVPSFLYAVIEANGKLAQKNKNNDVVDDNTGGYLLFISPGILYVSTRFALEASIQIPTIQNLNGEQPKTRFSLVAGIRVFF